MASPFVNFVNRNENPDDPVIKLQKEIEGMEFKKSSLISAVQNEIQVTRQKIDGELYQIGADMHFGHINNMQVDDKVHAHFDEIATLESVLAEKETKIKEISGRYDEEIGMLKANLRLMQPQYAVPGQGGGAACSNCGRPYAPGVDMFCMGCGQKLASAAPQPNTGTACTGCGRPYTPGEDMFCMGCGQKL